MLTWDAIVPEIVTSAVLHFIFQIMTSCWTSMFLVFPLILRLIEFFNAPLHSICFWKGINNLLHLRSRQDFYLLVLMLQITWDFLSIQLDVACGLKYQFFCLSHPAQPVLTIEKKKDIIVLVKYGINSSSYKQSDHKLKHGQPSKSRVPIDWKSWRANFNDFPFAT